MKTPSSIFLKLEERQKQNALRKLSKENYAIDFWSNDYLGFSKSLEIRQKSQQLLEKFPIQNGATGSRLISGNFELYTQTEQKIAKFHNAESCLIFNSGYDANIGIFSSIPQKNDVILYDQYIHASIRDGIQLSYAKSFKFKHNNLSDLEKLLIKNADIQGNIYIATESVFSMDGDSPNLIQMVNLAKKHKAFLIIDEAHALGVFGENGEGLVQLLGLENDVFIRLVTFGKGLGTHGAAVLTSEKVVTYLVNFARSFIYTTGLPPENISFINCAYTNLIKNNFQEKLHKNISFFQEKIKEFHLNDRVKETNTPIQTLIIPGNENVKSIAEILQKKGFGIKPILSPTIPKGEERLRICLHSFNTFEEIISLLETIQISIKNL